MIGLFSRSLMFVFWGFGFSEGSKIIHCGSRKVESGRAMSFSSGKLWTEGEILLLLLCYYKGDVLLQLIPALTPEPTLRPIEPALRFRT